MHMAGGATRDRAALRHRGPVYLGHRATAKLQEEDKDDQGGGGGGDTQEPSSSPFPAGEFPRG